MTMARGFVAMLGLMMISPAVVLAQASSAVDRQMEYYRRMGYLDHPKPRAWAPGGLGQLRDRLGNRHIIPMGADSRQNHEYLPVYISETPEAVDRGKAVLQEHPEGSGVPGDVKVWATLRPVLSCPEVTGDGSNKDVVVGREGKAIDNATCRRPLGTKFASWYGHASPPFPKVVQIDLIALAQDLPDGAYALDVGDGDPPMGELAPAQYCGGGFGAISVCSPRTDEERVYVHTWHSHLALADGDAQQALREVSATQGIADEHWSSVLEIDRALAYRALGRHDLECRSFGAVDKNESLRWMLRQYKTIVESDCHLAVPIPPGRGRR